MQLPSMKLTGKTAIITGSTRGIGYGIANGMAQAGANIVVVSRSQADCQRVAAEISSFGVRALPVAADVTNLSEIERLVARTVDTFGSIDILVNNAGTAITKKAEDITEADWDRVLNLDLKSVFFCSQIVGRQMIKQQRGKIINIASILGLVAEKMVLPYCVAKGGVVQLTRALALEWARYNIQVNALCPGYVITPINEEVLKDERVYNHIVKKTAVGRLGKIEDMAGAVVFMASDAADYMTGQTIIVDGGWTAQ